MDNNKSAKIASIIILNIDTLEVSITSFTTINEGSKKYRELFEEDSRANKGKEIDSNSYTYEVGGYHFKCSLVTTYLFTKANGFADGNKNIILSDEHNDNTWIKCSKELPKPNQEVIVKTGSDIFIATYKDDVITKWNEEVGDTEVKENWFETKNETPHMLSIDEVDKWMPIPKDN